MIVFVNILFFFYHSFILPLFGAFSPCRKNVQRFSVGSVVQPFLSLERTGERQRERERRKTDKGNNAETGGGIIWNFSSKKETEKIFVETSDKMMKKARTKIARALGEKKKL